MPSLGAGAGELPYAPLQAPILRDGRGVAAHDLGGQPEPLVLQALYLKARLLGPHAALHHCGRSSCATSTAAALCGLSASGGVVLKRASIPFTAFTTFTTFLQAWVPSRGGSTHCHPA